MEDRVDALRRRQQELVDQLAKVTAELNEASGAIQGVPHYSVIEEHAHAMGQQLSRKIQQCQMEEIVSHQALRASCPGCGEICDLQRRRRRRRILSRDGLVELEELVGYCRRCRRSFFPSAGGDGH